MDDTAAATGLRIRELALYQTVKIPLACFKGADLGKVDTPFRVTAQGGLVAAFANIQVVGGAAADADAVACVK